MRLSTRRVLLGTAVVLAAAGLGGTAAGTDTAASAKAGRLVSFGSCGELLGYAKSQAGPLVGPYGFGGRAVLYEAAAHGGRRVDAKDAGADPVQGVDYSGTNVQEQGVDEPDLVKTNGKTLFALANGKLDAVDVRTGKPRLLDSLPLDGGLRLRAAAAMATGCSCSRAAATGPSRCLRWPGR